MYQGKGRGFRVWGLGFGEGEGRAHIGFEVAAAPEDAASPCDCQQHDAGAWCGHIYIHIKRMHELPGVTGVTRYRALQYQLCALLRQC